MEVAWGGRGKRYEFDEFNSHPVVSAIGEQFEQLSRKREIVPGVPSCKFADDVDSGGDDTGIFVVEALAETRPGGSQQLG